MSLATRALTAFAACLCRYPRETGTHWLGHGAGSGVRRGGFGRTTGRVRAYTTGRARAYNGSACDGFGRMPVGAAAGNAERGPEWRSEPRTECESRF